MAMRLSRFFIEDELTLHQSFAPADTVTHYMHHVLRLKDGAEVLLFNGKTLQDYRAIITLEGKKLKLTPLEVISKNSDSTLQIHLLQAIGKPEHIDLALQKTTELGVSRISLFNSERTQTPIKGARLNKKLAHWRGVIISACEQCGRNLIPVLDYYPSLDDCLQQELPGNRLLLDFDAQPISQKMSHFVGAADFHCLIGAEGGLSENEIERAKAAHFDGVYLGPRVLRMETAAISIVTLIQHAFGDLG